VVFHFGLALYSFTEELAFPLADMSYLLVVLEDVGWPNSLEVVKGSWLFRPFPLSHGCPSTQDQDI